MNDDKGWDRIVDAIDIKFGIAKHGKSTRPVEDAQHLTEQISFIIFERDGERYKLERITGPAITDRRSVGSRRIGGETHMQNTYDPDEVVHKTVMYRENGDEWEQIDASALQL